LTLSSFAILWALNPSGEREQAQATQGIRLIGSAVFYGADDTSTPSKIKVGDLLIGDNEQVFHVNEIRKSQNNTIYVVVSWKYITSYTSYDAYQSEPYANYKTFELNSFAYNKHVITQPELQDFYSKFSDQIEKIEATRKAEVVIAPASQEHPVVLEEQVISGGAQPVTIVSAPPPPPAPAVPPPVQADAMDQQRVTSQLATDVYQRPQDRQVQAYSSAEVSKPTDLDEEALNRSLEAAAAADAEKKQDE